MKLKDFIITKCNISDTIIDSIRFCSHLLIIHFFSSLVEGKEKLFNRNLIKALFITTFAIFIYHIFVKKIFMNPVKKLKKICNKNKSDNLKEDIELDLDKDN